MAKMTPKVRNAHLIAAGLFLLPLVLVWVSINAAFKIGGANADVSAMFIYLLLWPLQIPLIVMIFLDLRQYLRDRKS
jgi:hypothetical protein